MEHILKRENLNDFVKYLLLIISFTAWLIRLEMKVLYIEKNYDLQIQTNQTLLMKLDSVEASLYRIEGRLDINQGK